MIVCGLDVSTSVCGYALVEYPSRKIIKTGYYKFKKNKNWDIYDLYLQFKEYVIPEIGIADKFVLEDFMKSYSFGRSSNRSIILLAQFNAVVYVLLKDTFGKNNVIRVHPSTARKRALGTAKRPAQYDSMKEWVLESVKEKYGLEYEMTPKGNPKPFYYDIADAIVLANALG